jgi:hypothetical protein
MEKLEAWVKSGKPFYVSITGLKPRGFVAFLLFWRYAIPSKRQADTAPGSLYVGVKTMNGIHHTLSAWENKELMKKYIYQGPHRRAIQIFRKIATGKTFGYESNSLPNWDEVHELWKTRGNDY